MSKELERFLSAQERSYQMALAEIRNGRKDSHWMWFIFPQLEGLGKSPTSQMYGIQGAKEAREYLENDVLSSRLLEISKTLLALETNHPEQVFGYTDAKKLQSCMTLFAAVDPEQSVFSEVLEKFFAGRKCTQTMSMLGLD